jgi:hypothetical protein
MVIKSKSLADIMGKLVNANRTGIFPEIQYFLLEKKLTPEKNVFLCSEF